MPAKFTLGYTVATWGALQTIEESAQTPYEFLMRHLFGDWGDLDDDDKEANNLALARGGRLLSAYHTSKKTKLWVITESDRSATTILLPSEY